MKLLNITILHVFSNHVHRDLVTSTMESKMNEWTDDLASF